MPLTRRRRCGRRRRRAWSAGACAPGGPQAPAGAPPTPATAHSSWPGGRCLPCIHDTGVSERKTDTCLNLPPDQPTRSCKPFAKGVNASVVVRSVLWVHGSTCKSPWSGSCSRPLAERGQGATAACCRGAACASCGVSPGDVRPSRKPLQRGDPGALHRTAHGHE